MKFCSVCQNMFYIEITNNDGDKLNYYCRNCGEREVLEDETVCISSSSTSEKDILDTFINQYTRLDPTLPRVTNILCPNNDCITNNTGNKITKEVLYIRYDNKNMKYAYMCVHCETVWKSIDNK